MNTKGKVVCYVWYIFERYYIYCSKGDLVEVKFHFFLFFFTLFLMGAGRGDEKTMQNWKKKSDYLRSFIVLQTCHLIVVKKINAKKGLG